MENEQTTMKPFNYNWTTKHKQLTVGSMIVVIPRYVSNVVAIIDPDNYKNITFQRAGISYGFRVKQLIGPFQHTFGYYFGRKHSNP